MPWKNPQGENQSKRFFFIELERRISEFTAVFNNKNKTILSSENCALSTP
jgi:hypothetical protein